MLVKNVERLLQGALTRDLPEILLQEKHGRTGKRSLKTP